MSIDLDIFILALIAAFSVGMLAGILYGIPYGRMSAAEKVSRFRARIRCIFPGQ